MKRYPLILAAFTLACASTAAMAQPNRTDSYGQTRSGDTDGAFVPSSGNTTDNTHTMPSESGFRPVNNSPNNNGPTNTTNTTGTSGNTSGNNSHSGAGTGSSGSSSGSRGSSGTTGGSMGAGR